MEIGHRWKLDIDRWEKAYNLAPRLKEFFSSNEAIDLERAIASLGEQTAADPEVLIFSLIFFVWPEESWTETASLDDLRRAGLQFRKAASQIDTLQSKGVVLPDMRHMRLKLIQWADQFDVMVAPGSKVPNFVRRVGNLSIQESRGKVHSKRDLPKRRVVFFLTGYFSLEIGCRRPPWDVINRFLVLADLTGRSTTPKSTGTWWSNVLGRELREDEPLEPHQKGLIQLFKQIQSDLKQSHIPPAKPEA